MKPSTTEIETIQILSVEDSEAQQYLIQRALEEAGGKFNVAFAGDGTEALQYLRKEGKYSKAARPHLVLLDLNLPGKDGKEVLREIKEDENLQNLPVLILTSSQLDDDRLQCEQLHADAFMTKPFDPVGYGALLQMIDKLCEALGEPVSEAVCESSCES